MVPTLFAMNAAHDCGPKSPDGLPIPASLLDNTQVLRTFFPPIDSSLFVGPALRCFPQRNIFSSTPSPFPIQHNTLLPLDNAPSSASPAGENFLPGNSCSRRPVSATEMNTSTLTPTIRNPAQVGSLGTNTSPLSSNNAGATTACGATRSSPSTVDSTS